MVNTAEKHYEYTSNSGIWQINSEKRILPDLIAAIGYVLRIDRQLYKE